MKTKDKIIIETSRGEYLKTIIFTFGTVCLALIILAIVHFIFKSPGGLFLVIGVYLSIYFTNLSSVSKDYRNAYLNVYNYSISGISNRSNSTVVYVNLKRKAKKGEDKLYAYVNPFNVLSKRYSYGYKFIEYKELYIEMFDVLYNEDYLKMDLKAIDRNIREYILKTEHVDIKDTNDRRESKKVKDNIKKLKVISHE